MNNIIARAKTASMYLPSTMSKILKKRTVKLMRQIRHLIHAKDYNYIKGINDYSIGSEKWLQAAEKHFGGYITGVERQRVSGYDPRNEKQIKTGGMTGGDRMFHHNYAKAYARHLERLLGEMI